MCEKPVANSIRQMCPIHGVARFSHNHDMFAIQQSIYDQLPLLSAAVFWSEDPVTCHHPPQGPVKTAGTKEQKLHG